MTSSSFISPVSVVSNDSSYPVFIMCT